MQHSGVQAGQVGVMDKLADFAFGKTVGRQIKGVDLIRQAGKKIR